MLYAAIVAKKISSFRMTPDARQYQIQLAKNLGINQTAVLELAIRALAAQVLFPPAAGTLGLAAATTGESHG
jgi:hypothetical protein